eukprot:6441456-Prymnesium_polylepis.2
MREAHVDAAAPAARGLRNAPARARVHGALGIQERTTGCRAGVALEVELGEYAGVHLPVVAVVARAVQARRVSDGEWRE